MFPVIQTLEPRRLLSATPSQAVLDAMAKVQADIVQMHTNADAFHTSVANTNSTFLAAKSAALAQLKADLAANSSSTVIAADRQVMKNAVTALTASLKADVAAWKSTHQNDLTTLHDDIVALQQARKAAH